MRKTIFKISKWLLGICAFLFVAGWLITWPTEDFTSYPLGSNSQKIIIVKTFNVPWSMNERVDSFYSIFRRFHWNRPCQTWIYNIQRDMLSRTSYALNNEEIVIAGPTFALRTGRIVAESYNRINKKWIIRILLSNGKVESQNTFINQDPYSIAPSADGHQLFLYKFGKMKPLILNLETGKSHEIKDFPGGDIFNPVWLNNNEMYFYMRYREYRNSVGIYRYDFKSAPVRIVTYDELPYDISIDGKTIVYSSGQTHLLNKSKKHNKTHDIIFFSLDTQKTISRFQTERSCINPMLQPGSDNVLLMCMKFATRNGKMILLFDRESFVLFDPNGKKLNKITFKNTQAMDVEWVSPNYYFANTAQSNNLLLFPWLEYMAIDGAIINSRTGKITKISDILRKHDAI